MFRDLYEFLPVLQSKLNTNFPFRMFFEVEPNIFV
jgi:hypothetical protein